MEQILIQNAGAYASLHGLQLAERLGFGVHGIVFAAGNNLKGGETAVKAHRFAEPHLRERAVYERLKEASICEVLGFHVPQLIRSDDALRIIEISIVTRPFVLDFAGAYLDNPPDLSEEVWTEWEIQKAEQFDARWPIVRSVLAVFEELDIHILDVTPNNIAFID